MIFHTIADFIQIWQEEAEKTEKLFSALTEEALNIVLVPGSRTLRQLISHIIETPSEMLARTGLKVKLPENFEQTASTLPLLIEAHRLVSHEAAHQIQIHWHNKDLHHTDDMYGEQWTRSKTLTALLCHLIHHRGQMTVFMRIAGLKVSGMYGPAKEEWQLYGMEPPVEN